MAESSVGPYRILERLGAGANGEVFLAEDTRLHRRVALKRLSDHGIADRLELRRKLLREARAAARLNHPNIAAVHDVVETDAAVHIVMEYAPGITLAARVRQGPLPPMQVLDYALQLSSALVHAHELGVVHRDLKPANVIVSETGQAKILDFGLARLHQPDIGGTPPGSSDSWAGDARRVAGTPPYMPPELLRGEGTDTRGDIYSLGVSLYELLTARRPFEGRDGTALTAAILTAPTPRPRTLIPDVPPGFDEAVFRAMARNPLDRYESAAVLEGDLRRISAGITDTPTVSRRWPLLLAPKQRRLGWTALAVLAVGVAVYGAVGVPTRLGRPIVVSSATAAGPHVIAVLPMAVASADRQLESLAAGISDSLVTTLSRVAGLTVISRTATLGYQTRTADVGPIARDLGATLLLDGRLQRSGERFRLTLRVVEAPSNLVPWQQSYVFEVDDIPVLQDRVAAAMLSVVRSQAPAGAVVASTTSPTPNADAFAEYSQGRAFLDRRDVQANVDRSIVLFQSAIAKDPSFARAQAALGEAFRAKYLYTRDADLLVAARDASIEALRLDPGDPWVRYSLALIYRTIGRNEQAMAELEQLVHRYPGHDEGHALLGELLLAKGSTEEGLTSIRRAIALRPAYWRYHQALGVGYSAIGAWGEAEQAFRRVTELQPDSAWGFQALGTVYHLRGDFDVAIKNYQKAIELGSDALAYLNMGSILYERRNYQGALAAYEKANGLEPGSPSTHRNLGDVFAKLGRSADSKRQYETAVLLLQQSLRTNPSDAGTLVNLAVCEAKLGRLSGAGRHASAALGLAPRDAEVLYKAAVVSALTGRAEDCLRLLSAAAERGYSTDVISRDDDLASVRDDARFKALSAKETQF